ncbi:MAG: hypothetical protein K6E81_09400 [Lachnospiraceae bacterium]|nr:hypothetical protein [Lachnospiraceae bacterium]
MRYPFFASFIIFLFVLAHAIRRGRRLRDREESDFWNREEEANSTRRKPLDDLHFIKIPLDRLPMTVCSDSAEVRGCVAMIMTLSEEKIVNLTGLTNTDLKLMYGAPNLPELTIYDENFTLLVQTLQKWSTLLWEAGEREAAVCIMEYEVEIRADAGSAYRRLAAYYRETGQPERIEELRKSASMLRSLSRSSILRSLDAPGDGKDSP